jgi:hypothetical protein
MKKSFIGAAVLLSLAFAGSASAQTFCSLYSSSDNVPAGAPFTLGFEVVYEPGELKSVPQFPPVSPPQAPFTITFYGDKDGVPDIGPAGETYPGTFDFGPNTLTGYANPGGLTGTYLRYGVIRDASGKYVCRTNSISIYLQ